mmetsp:Transcript_10334/g.24762  ORF Transcript_10334/g.24762 Transcript_10334/m.24762 type:complete len:159 (+) Transcript_10334:62-538(+)
MAFGGGGGYGGGAASGAKADDPAHLKATFELFDEDCDGKISADQLGTLLRSCGRNPTNAEVQQYAAAYAGGLIDFQQFQQILSQATSGATERAEVIESFRVFDKDGNGQLSAAELRHVMGTMGEPLTPEEVDELIREADANGDGMIDFAEFVRQMMQV